MLVERPDARQIGAAEGQQVGLQGIDFARLAIDVLVGAKLVEVPHVGGLQAEWTGGADRRVAQRLEQGCERVAHQLDGCVEQDDDGAAAGAQREVATGRCARVVVDPEQSYGAVAGGQLDQGGV